MVIKLSSIGVGRKLKGGLTSAPAGGLPGHAVRPVVSLHTALAVHARRVVLSTEMP